MERRDKPNNISTVSSEILAYWPVLTAFSFLYGLLFVTGQMSYFSVNPVGLITPNDLMVTTVILFSGLFLVVSYSVGSAPVLGGGYGWLSYLLVGIIWILTLAILLLPPSWLQLIQNWASPLRLWIADLFQAPWLRSTPRAEATKDLGWLFFLIGIATALVVFWRTAWKVLSGFPATAIPLAVISTAIGAYAFGYLSSSLASKYSPTYEFSGAAPAALESCKGGVRLSFHSERVSVLQCACNGAPVVMIGGEGLSLRVASNQRCDSVRETASE